MTYDDDRDQGDEQGESENEGQDAVTPIAIATTDPVIDLVVEHQSDWKTYPDSTVSVETSQVVEPNPLYAPGVRTVVVESHSHHDDGRSGGKGRRGHSDQQQGRNPRRDQQHDQEDQDEDDDQDQGRGKSRQESRHDGGSQPKKGPQKPPWHDEDRTDEDDDQDDGHSQHEGKSKPHQASMIKKIKQPSMMRNLVITAVVALLGGMIGAMGYSYFFGPDSGKSSSDQSKGGSKSSSSGDSGSSDKSSSKGDDSGESSSKGGSSGEKSKGENSQIKNNAVSSRTLHEDADNVKWQMAELAKQVDHLGEKIDGMSHRKDEPPPALRTIQMQMSEMAHDINEVAALPAMVRQFDKRAETLLEEIKTVRARLDAVQGDPMTGRAPAVLRPTNGAVKWTAGSQPSGAGIGAR